MDEVRGSAPEVRALTDAGSLWTDSFAVWTLPGPHRALKVRAWTNTVLIWISEFYICALFGEGCVPGREGTVPAGDGTFPPGVVGFSCVAEPSPAESLANPLILL